MLRQLAIRDVVLVDRLELEFEPGLCALTGETGAGKSILLDALGLALGARADSGLVRGEWIRKRLADTSVRKAVFVRHKVEREGGEDVEDGFRDGWTRWRLRAISGAEITSDGGTRVIESVRLQVGDRIDVTVTDPLELQVRSELVRLPAGTPVHVTVETADPTDVVVLYARWGRMRLRRMDDGSFQGRFLTPRLDGLRHLAVNALSRGTLFDDEAPYDSKAWALPYVVVADEPTAAN